MVTIVLLAVVSSRQGKNLDAEAAFTVVATLAIVSHPANMVMTLIPRAVASLASFERIQEYLLDVPVRDRRESQRPPAHLPGSTQAEPLGIRLQDVTVGLSTGPSPAILKDISFQVNKGTITICAGPVGSGKSSLAKVILGEVEYRSGSLAVCSTRIGYCDQNSWLPSGRLKDIVCAFAKNIDETRYQEILAACCLTGDLANLSQGDETKVGSRGINLSGGQRQRLVRCCVSKSWLQVTT